MAGNQRVTGDRLHSWMEQESKSAASEGHRQPEGAGSPSKDLGNGSTPEVNICCQAEPAGQRGGRWGGRCFPPLGCDRQHLLLQSFWAPSFCVKCIGGICLSRPENSSSSKRKGFPSLHKKGCHGQKGREMTVTRFPSGISSFVAFTTLDIPCFFLPNSLSALNAASSRLGVCDRKYSKVFSHLCQLRQSKAPSVIRFLLTVFCHGI